MLLVGPRSWWILCLCFFAGLVKDAISHLVNPCPLAQTGKHRWSCGFCLARWGDSLTSFPGI